MVSYRTGPAIGDCLSHLLAAEDVTEVILVDNGNAPAETAYLDELALSQPRLTLIRPGRNLGFAQGCNRGAALAVGEYIALVNPDLIVPPGTFSTVADALARHPDGWLCGARLCNLDGSEQRGGRREVVTPWRALAEVLRLDRLFPRHPHFRRIHKYNTPTPCGVIDVSTVSGAFMILPRRHWLSLAGMDERMFLHMEDADICLRVLKAGGRVLFCGDAPVYHHLGTSDVPRAFVEWHKSRSAAYYFRKHFSDVYPGWALGIVNFTLWIRWAIVTLLNGPGDLRWVFGRLRGAVRGSPSQDSDDLSQGRIDHGGHPGVESAELIAGGRRQSPRTGEKESHQDRRGDQRRTPPPLFEAKDGPYGHRRHDGERIGPGYPPGHGFGHAAHQRHQGRIEGEQRPQQAHAPRRRAAAAA
ncbi:MAG: glycosyltransferase family 2 protein [Magnetospirillum sp.]|nr:glycosyltransferase family 2 protein [Magnetospirillum sp.]